MRELISLQSLGAAIRTARLTKTPMIRQSELAERIGVSNSYLSQVERDAAAPKSEDMLRRIAAELDVSPLILLFLAGVMPGEVGQMLRFSTPEKVDAAYQAFLNALKE